MCEAMVWQMVMRGGVSLFNCRSTRVSLTWPYLALPGLRIAVQSVICTYVRFFSTFFWFARPLPVAVTNDGIISREDVFDEELF